MLPRSLPKQLSNQHPNLDRFWNQRGSILGGFGEPSWSQDRTKSLQKSIQRMIKKMITFWMALEPDFSQFWLQLGGSRGDPGRPSSSPFWLLSWPWPPNPPMTPPRGLLDPPRTPPRGLLDPPRAPPRGLLGPILASISKDFACISGLGIYVDR